MTVRKAAYMVKIGHTRHAYSILSRNLLEIVHLENREADGWVTLGWILGRYV
jgi:hypothetical protein